MFGSHAGSLCRPDTLPDAVQLGLFRFGCGAGFAGDCFAALNNDGATSAVVDRGCSTSDRLAWNLSFALTRRTADARVHPDPAP